MNMTAFWDTAPCSFVEVDRCFRGAYCLRHQGDVGGSLKRWSFQEKRSVNTLIYKLINILINFIKRVQHVSAVRPSSGTL
jgi:hypothetical protein